MHPAVFDLLALAPGGSRALPPLSFRWIFIDLHPSVLDSLDHFGNLLVTGAIPGND